MKYQDISLSLQKTRFIMYNHNNGGLFACEVNVMLFSHAEISCFRAKALLVFHWCLYINMLYRIARFTVNPADLEYNEI